MTNSSVLLSDSIPYSSFSEYVSKLLEIDAVLVQHETHLQEITESLRQHGICCTRKTVGGRDPSGGEIVEKGRREGVKEDDEITENRPHLDLL
ncbi:hypothetical protein F2Q69_00009896 [Brassica cretica]|uniref:Uncharacterized protein n=1 Tax=Brassica cretica TaxID=69181 RepID=A0A8S9P255_BRACR|nr:hypothetical protein F2Q69_00009896 [Brassica cretica]